MKKSGFTLSELVITLGIIGVAATLCMTVIGDIIPDKNKISILDYQSAINSAIDDIFSNEELYHPSTTIDATTNQSRMSCEGIGCVTNFEDELKSRLKINGVNGPNNSVWTFGAGNTQNSYRVLIDLDGNKNGCTYSSKCDEKKADIFILYIDTDGNITPGDALTEAYMENPLKMNDRKKDIATAKTLIQKYEPKE